MEYKKNIDSINKFLSDEKLTEFDLDNFQTDKLKNTFLSKAEYKKLKNLKKKIDVYINHLITLFLK